MRRINFENTFHCWNSDIILLGIPFHFLHSFHVMSPYHLVHLFVLCFTLTPSISSSLSLISILNSFSEFLLALLFCTSLYLCWSLCLLFLCLWSPLPRPAFPWFQPLALPLDCPLGLPLGLLIVITLTYSYSFSISASCVLLPYVLFSSTVAAWAPTQVFTQVPALVVAQVCTLCTSLSWALSSCTCSPCTALFYVSLLWFSSLYANFDDLRQVKFSKPVSHAVCFLFKAPGVVLWFKK